MAEHLYRWRGRDRTGQWVRGEGLAASRAELQRVLQSDRIRLCFCSRVWRWPTPPWWRPTLRDTDVTHLCRQLATLLHAGLPLLQALRLMTRGLAEGPQRALLHALADGIESGQPFSAALRSQPLFDATFCNLVAAGESAGQLDTVLARLAEHREKTHALQRALRSALVYPGVVLAIGGGVAVLLLGFVVPTFEQIFTGLGVELPWLTQAVLAFSRTWQTHGPWLAPLALAACLMLRHVLHHTPSGQRLRDAQRLRWPIWGPLTRQAQSARWCRTLATLLTAGIPLHEALDTVGDVLDHGHYRTATRTIRQQLGRGTALAVCLEAQAALFEPLLVQMCAIGEESGTLDAMLARMAGHYEQQVETTVARLATLLEPVILLVLGLLMGTLVLAMYWPIFQLGQVL